ncbi:MAG: hypothetical protein RIQ79_2234 [Verrucomicrobiota bacterium]
MTDLRFKELLNLYLDHRLGEAEAVEFEQALRADATRRKMLRDYTLIQGGCAELFQRAAAQAPSSAAVCRSLRSVESRLSRSASGETSVWRSWTFGAGFAGIGLAACATAFVVLRTGGPGDQAAPFVGGQPKAVEVAEITPADTAVPVVVEGVSELQKARNLTLATLGLAGDDASSARADKHWADAQETYELANLSPSARSWIISTSAQEANWTQAQPVSMASMQTGAGGGGWSQGASAYRIESAGFRFER